MFCCLVGRKPGWTELCVSVLERTGSSASPVLLPSSGMRRRGKALTCAEHLPAVASASYSLDIPVYTCSLWVSQVLSWVYGTLPLFPPHLPPALPRLSATKDSSLNTSYLNADGIYRMHYKQEISNAFGSWNCFLVDGQMLFPRVAESSSMARLHQWVCSSEIFLICVLHQPTPVPHSLDGGKREPFSSAFRWRPYLFYCYPLSDPVSAQSWLICRPTLPVPSN